MNTKNLTPVIILTAICFVVAILLGTVNLLTRDQIALNEQKKEQAALYEVLPSEAGFDLIESTDGMPETVRTVYKEKAGLGYVIVVNTSTQYSSGDTVIVVGIKGGEVVGAKLASYFDSKELPTDYPGRFIGKDIDSYSNVELVAGVTYSSTAFRDAIGDALVAEAMLTSADVTASSGIVASPLSSTEETLPKTESELSALISELTGGKSATEIELTNAPATLKKLYAVTDGVVAYIVVAGEYVPVATEALVYVDGNGEVKDVNLLSWVVGHGVEPGSFANGFINKDAYTADDAELVTGATGTSKDFKDALKAALSYIADELEVREALVFKLARAIAGGEITELTLPADAPTALKRIFTTENGGAIAYVVVPGAYVPVATEALISVDSRGVIRAVKLMSWIVGHGVEPGDFAERFVGKSFWNIGEVTLVSGATGTSEDFYNNTNEALLFVTDMIYSRENVLLDTADAMIPNSGEIVKLELPEDAPKELVAIYEDLSGKGSVAHIVVAGEYVSVATEALVYFDELGTIRKVDLRQWVVGHGIEPGDFAERFVGKNKDTISEVELVTGATGTSRDFRDALVAAMPYIPAEFPIWRVVGACAMLALIVGVAAYTVFTKKRRAAK